MHRPWLMAGISIFALASTSANSGDVKLADRIVGTWKLVAVDESADEKQWTKRPLPGSVTKTFTADGQIKWSVQPNSAEKSKDRKPGVPPHPSIGGNYSINEAGRTLLDRLGRSPLLPGSQGEAPIAISLSGDRLEERSPLSGQLSIGPTPRFLRTRWERTPS